jgi:hypothetical protein
MTVEMPNGTWAVVCGPRARRKKRPPAKATPAELPLEGGGETERRRLERMLACVEREAGKRRRLYPRWVADQWMLSETADRWLAEWGQVETALRQALRGEAIATRAEVQRLLMIVSREVARRRNVYPGQVSQGRMTQQFADRELAEMTEVEQWLIAIRNPLT